jgi:hypothetical protein
MREIERRLGVARSTVSRWVRELELTEDQQHKLLKEGTVARSRARSAYYRAQRLRYQEEGREEARRRDWLHAAGCMLFWAEGSKHRNVLQLVNADPDVVEFFMRFVRRYFPGTDQSVRVLCNLFADHESRRFEIEDFWLEAVGLTRNNLTQSVVNNYSNASKRTRINKLPYGTCRVSLYSTRAVQHVYGALQEYGGFHRPEWLD